MSEIWKAIPGYEGHYEVSNCGRIRSLDRLGCNGVSRLRGKMKPTHPYARGQHLGVTLQIGPKRKRFFVHRLVIAAFVGPCPSGMQVCHNDGNGHNNNLDNLRYDTREGNWADRWKHGAVRVGADHYKAKLTEQDVRDLRSGRRTASEVAKARGVTHYAAWMAKTGRTWAHVS